jgi:antirestriction protein ArdC
MTDKTAKSSRKYEPLKPRVVPEARKRTDVHEAITAKVVAAIEAGAGEFQMPWHRPGVAFTIPKNAVTGNAYRGSNVLSLWIDAEEKKFEHQVWATYKQYEAAGAQVRKGEKGSLIVKYGTWVPKDGKGKEPPPSDADSNDEDPKRMFAKAAWVFNIDQVDVPAELRATLVPAAAPRRDLTERLEAVERFVAAVGIEIREGGQRGFYRHPGSTGDGDFIQMPPRELFTGTATSSPTEAYYSTLLHEEIHGSGAKHRLDRQFGERFADKAYAFEELVAELGAAFLCAHLEVTNTPRPDHAQYIAHWLAVLKDDNRAIFSAASLATRAVDYLMGLQPKPEPDPTPHEPGDPTARLAPAGEKPEGPA